MGVKLCFSAGSCAVALLSYDYVSLQPFKASTRSTRSRASRRLEVWTASTRGCLPVVTAISTRPPLPSTTCRPAPDLRTRTAPTHRPKSSPLSFPHLPFFSLLFHLSFLPSFFPPCFLPFPSSLL